MSGSQNEKLTKSEEDLAFCIKQPRYNRIAAHLYLFEPFSKKNTCQGTVLCQSIFSLPSAFCTSMHFESSPKHHSLEDWHGYCISLRNKLLTCKCHIFNFQSIGVISHDRNWDFCWAPTPNPKKKQPIRLSCSNNQVCHRGLHLNLLGKKTTHVQNSSNYQGSWSETT